ncbi:hypothetical protein FM106_31450 [Brachybacterium faecium]|nr:hypothetical protein FM106_31450 [Brachybacterium faecium]
MRRPEHTKTVWDAATASTNHYINVLRVPFHQSIFLAFE